MASFNYKAKDSRTGNIVEGTVEASDSRNAAGQIREMGYWPIEVAAAKGQRTSRPASTGFGLGPLWTGVSIRSQAVFFRQLATMVAAGMSLSESLDSLGRNSGMGRLSAIARQGADHIRAGGMLSQVFCQYPHIFSQMQIGLVQAGERAGGLDTMIERLATYLERELELRHKFARITFYPKLLFIAIICIPHFPAMFLGGMPAVIDFLKNVVLLYSLIGLGLYVVIRTMLVFPPFRYGWDWFKLIVPVLGGVTRKLAMARFSSALSVMYSAGLPMSQAVEYSCGSLGNEILYRGVSRVAPRLREGGSLTDALRRVGHIPDLVMSMVSTGEKTGAYSTVLDKLKDYYTTEAETTLEKTGFLLFVFLILLAGVFVLVNLLGGYGHYLHGLGLN